MLWSHVGVVWLHGRHGSGENDKRIWNYSSYTQLADAMRLRGAMVPWVYTLAQAAHARSMPFLRPMWFDFPSLLPPWSPPQPKGDTCTAGGVHVGSDAVDGSRSPTQQDGLRLQTQVRAVGKGDLAIFACTCAAAAPSNRALLPMRGTTYSVWNGTCTPYHWTWT